MPRIVVELPQDRTKVGTLRLINDEDITVAGPFAAYGRSDQKTAAKKGNPARSPLKLYGDAPYGAFDIVDIVKTGDGSRYSASSYGNHGAIRLRPTGGEAAEASQNGRTGIMIHGGDDPGVKLRPTNGSVRLSNKDMKALLEAIAILTIGGPPPDTCLLEPSDAATVATGGLDEGYDESDPPPEMSGDWHLIALSQAPPLVGAHHASKQGGESYYREPSHDREPANHEREAVGSTARQATDSNVAEPEAASDQGEAATTNESQAADAIENQRVGGDSVEEAGASAEGERAGHKPPSSETDTRTVEQGTQERSRESREADRGARESERSTPERDAPPSKVP